MTENKEFTDKYELGKKIGGGGFGTIKEATIKNKDKKEEEKVAVKIIDKDHIINSFIGENDYNVPTEEQKQSLYKEIYNEINIMQLVQEKNNRNTQEYMENRRSA